MPTGFKMAPSHLK